MFITLIILTNVGLACWAISAGDTTELEIFYSPIFWIIQIVSSVTFLIEYGLRLWACVEDAKLHKRGAMTARCFWIVKPLSLLDLFSMILVLVGFVAAFEFHENQATGKRLILEIRLLLLMRFERQLKALGRLKRIIGSEVGELALAGFFTLCLTIYSGVIFYFLEKTGNDDMSMGLAIWWGVQTITSLGYGTVLPKTTAGKILSGVLALFGLIAFAIPAGIISSRFAIIASEERREKRKLEKEINNVETDKRESSTRDTIAQRISSSSTDSPDRTSWSLETKDEMSVEELQEEVHRLREKVRLSSSLLTLAASPCLDSIISIDP